MAAADTKLVLDGVAWASNVLTSVCIIFINKVLMSGRNGYGFQYGERLLSNKLFTYMTKLELLITLTS